MALVARLRAAGLVLRDTRLLVGDHLRQFGAIEILRLAYLRRLHVATRLPARLGGRRRLTGARPAPP